MSCAVVPVKELATSKSRLLLQLAAEEREELALAMLEDVLTALLATPALDRVAVASPDPSVAETAERLGAEVLGGPDEGLNPAIDAAAQKLELAPGEPYLVVLGDVAGAKPEDLQSLFDLLDEARDDPHSPAAVLARSHDGGTSALLRAPHDAIPACFGRQSATRHRDAAKAAGVPLGEVDLPSLGIDLDQADDVELFLSGPGAGGNTRRVLADLGWSRRQHGRGKHARAADEASEGDGEKA